MSDSNSDTQINPQATNMSHDEFTKKARLYFLKNEELTKKRTEFNAGIRDLRDEVKDLKSDVVSYMAANDINLDLPNGDIYMVEVRQKQPPLKYDNVLEAYREFINSNAPRGSQQDLSAERFQQHLDEQMGVKEVHQLRKKPKRKSREQTQSDS